MSKRTFYDIFLNESCKDAAHAQNISHYHMNRVARDVEHPCHISNTHMTFDNYFLYSFRRRTIFKNTSIFLKGIVTLVSLLLIKLHYHYVFQKFGIILHIKISLNPQTFCSKGIPTRLTRANFIWSI